VPQSLAKVYLHVIFSTKNREQLLAEVWREELFRIIGGSTNQLGCQSIIVGGVADHVHLLFQLSRTITIADAVGRLKSTSSAWVNQSQEMTNEFHWQKGYAVFSISQTKVEAVRKYIELQPERHGRQSYEDELRTWLKEYELDWDESYLWD
jgi:putative transposase